MGVAVSKNYFVTRWALSTGVREVAGKFTDCGKYFRSEGGGLFVSRSETFETEEGCRVRVLSMISAKLQALSRQVAKLEKLRASLEAGGALPMQKRAGT